MFETIMPIAKCQYITVWHKYACSTAKRSIGTIILKTIAQYWLRNFILHGNTQCIKLLDNFCNMAATDDALIERIFPDLCANYINHAWLHEQAIFWPQKISILTQIISKYNNHCLVMRYFLNRSRLLSIRTKQSTFLLNTWIH